MGINPMKLQACRGTGSGKMERDTSQRSPKNVARDVSIVCAKLIMTVRPIKK